MNDLGTLATNITSYRFDIDDTNHDVCFVSGWLEANLGSLNGYTQEEFTLETGNFVPEIEPVEEAIYTYLYEIDYYNKRARSALMTIDSTGSRGGLTSLREGDTIVHFANTHTSKHLVAREYREACNAVKKNLDDLVAKYEFYKASPKQVAGLDGLTWTISTDD